jgi:hypothetical protein
VPCERRERRCRNVLLVRPFVDYLLIDYLLCVPCQVMWQYGLHVPASGVGTDSTHERMRGPPFGYLLPALATLVAMIWTSAEAAEAGVECLDAADSLVEAASGGLLMNCQQAASFCAMDPRLPAACAKSCGTCDGEAECLDAADSLVEAASGGLLKNCQQAASFCAMDPRLPAACAKSCGTCDQANEAQAEVGSNRARKLCSLCFNCTCVQAAVCTPARAHSDVAKLLNACDGITCAGGCKEAFSNLFEACVRGACACVGPG